jgi:Ca2+-binding EF-hand superfamily protein
MKYDIDGDGVISSEDLIEAFSRKGKFYSTVYINEVIRRRDLTGRGSISLKDFITHFQKSV